MTNFIKSYFVCFCSLKNIVQKSMGFLCWSFTMIPLLWFSMRWKVNYPSFRSSDFCFDLLATNFFSSFNSRLIYIKIMSITNIFSFFLQNFNRSIVISIFFKKKIMNYRNKCFTLHFQLFIHHNSVNWNFVQRKHTLSKLVQNIRYLKIMCMNTRTHSMNSR